MDKKLSEIEELVDNARESLLDTSLEMRSIALSFLAMAKSMEIIASILSEAQDNYTRSIKVKDVGRP
jgi:hypothetical protein